MAKKCNSKLKMKKGGNVPEYEFGGQEIGQILGTGIGLGTMAFGVPAPIAMGLGNTLGGLGSSIGGSFDEQQPMQPQQPVYQPLAVQQQQYAPTFKMGGYNMTPNTNYVELEKNEVYATPQGDIEKVNMNSHENATEDNIIGLQDGSIVFSDTLKTDKGNTFAKEADGIRKKIDKLSKKNETTTASKIARNTNLRMLEKYKQQLGDLFQQQEQSKMEAGIIDDSEQAVQQFGKGGLTQAKAKIMLKEGKANGQPLTEAQRGYFGYIAGGGQPQKAWLGLTVPPASYQFQQQQELLPFQQQTLQDPFNINKLTDPMSQVNRIAGTDQPSMAAENISFKSPYTEGQQATVDLGGGRSTIDSKGNVTGNVGQPSNLAHNLYNVAPFVAPAANLARAIFDKPAFYDQRDYAVNTRSEAPKTDVSPQLRALENIQATQFRNLRDLSPAQRLAGMTQVGVGASERTSDIYNQASNIDAQRQMAADQINLRTDLTEAQKRLQINMLNEQIRDRRDALQNAAVSDIPKAYQQVYVNNYKMNMVKDMFPNVELVGGKWVVKGTTSPVDAATQKQIDVVWNS